MIPHPIRLILRAWLARLRGDVASYHALRRLARWARERA